MVEAIAMAHGWEMQHDPNVVVIGQDVGANGGVFRATAGLQKRFGKDRVQDLVWAPEVKDEQGRALSSPVTWAELWLQNEKEWSKYNFEAADVAAHFSMFAQWEKEALRLLERVGIPSPRERLGAYPHELSGGMRQRALIAVALACGPSLLIADEPTSALDAVTQRSVSQLFQKIRRERGLGLLLATHDLELAAELCDRIAVLYAGRIVEQGAVSDLLSRPRHPYTGALLRTLPPPLGDPPVRLVPVPGSPPPSWARPSGCSFRDRCSRALPDCAAAEPALGGPPGRQVACFHPLEAA